MLALSGIVDAGTLGQLVSLFQKVTSSFKTMSTGDKLRNGFESMSSSLGPSSSADTVMLAFRMGDYEAALKRAEGLPKTSHDYLLYRGLVLHKLGKLDEALMSLDRAAIMEGLNKKQMAQNYLGLGLVLRDKGMTEEAVLCFEESLKHQPDHGSFYRAMSTALLLGGIRPADAVQKAQVSVNLENRLQVSSPDSLDMSLCESVSVLAWAHAANTKDEWEVGKLEREAKALLDVTNKPAAGMVYFSFGKAYLALDKLAQSAENFEKAARLEPQGNYGRWSSEALEGMPQPAAMVK